MVLENIGIGCDIMSIKVLLFVIAFVPIVSLGSFVYYKDKNKEPIKILIEMFLAGIVATFITVMLSTLLGILVPGYSELYNSRDYVGLYAFSLISVALLQEFSKWVLVYILGYNNKEYDEPYDMIVYSLFISLGFAFIENLIYVYDGGANVSLFKAFGDVVLQACMGVFIGYFISLAKLAHIDKKPYIKYVILSLAVPCILHSILDYLLILGNLVFIFLFIVVIVVAYYFAYKNISRLSSMDRVIENDGMFN